MGLAAAAVIGGVASVGGALLSGSAAKSAANTQAQAANQAAQLQAQQYQQTRGDLLPYNTTGQGANAAITGMGQFDFAPTQENLASTPGYQFALTQGLKSTQNAAAARGLGGSGAALKGAAAYATGLANQTYQDRFNNALDSYKTNLNRLQGQATLGENAASMTGNYGTQTAQAIGQAQVGAANASAAGTVGAAKAAASGLTGVANSFLTNQFLANNGQQGIYGGGGNVSTGAMNNLYGMINPGLGTPGDYAPSIVG